jgi:hypothetical protein
MKQGYLDGLRGRGVGLAVLTPTNEHRARRINFPGRLSIGSLHS